MPEEFGDDPLTPFVEGFSEYFQITGRTSTPTAPSACATSASLRVGYANEQFEREGRGFSEVVARTPSARLYDATLLQGSVRAAFDTGSRRGDGFILSGVDYEEGPAGTQPGLRYYDEADRDRTRAIVVAQRQPDATVVVFVQCSTTRTPSWATSPSRPAASSSA